jgi:hypothetical protein
MVSFNPNNYDDSHLQITHAAKDLVSKNGDESELTRKRTFVKQGDKTVCYTKIDVGGTLLSRASRARRGVKELATKLTHRNVVKIETEENTAEMLHGNAHNTNIQRQNHRGLDQTDSVALENFFKFDNKLIISRPYLFH